MRKLIIKIIVSIILIGIAIGTFFIVNNLSNKDSGTINIKLYDINDNMISDNDINYKKEDKLIDILENNYTISTTNSTYGIVLLDIDDIKTDFKTTYIAIYIDDKYSNYGVSGIKLYNGMKISFKEEMVRYYS